MKRLSFLLGVLLLFSGAAFAQQQYEKEVFVSAKGDSLPYRLLRPETVRPGEKYPLVLFLHGSGERGNDNQKQLTHGGQMFLNPVNREEHPAFVLFPQCPENGYWAYDERTGSFEPDKMPLNNDMSAVFKTLKQLIDSYLVKPEIDKDRIYVVGLSMGGMAVYDLAIRYPQLFAAAVPICGSVNPARLPAAKDVNFRIFHGDADDIVTVEASRSAYRALKKAGAEVEYIEFPGCNHGSWTPAFNYPDFMEWLFEQHK